MEILHPELKYAIRRHRGLSKRPKERLVGKHKRRKEKYARTIRKHLAYLIGDIVLASSLVFGATSDLPKDTTQKKPNAPQIDLPDTEEAEETMVDTNNFSPPTLETPGFHNQER